LKHNIFIRTDGSHEIGLGHIIRCSALANMLKEKFNITFFCKELPELVIGEIKKNGFNLRKISKEEKFISLLKSNNIVVLDGYGFDTDYQKRIKDTGAILVCIDDLHDKTFYADLIINHTPGITKQDYNAQPHTLFALGLDYALLRPFFLEQAKKSRKIKEIKTLFICFGGSDFNNLTQISLEAALGFSEFQKIIVVTGPAYRKTEEFIQLLSSDKRIHYRYALDEKEMLNSIMEAELAIVPASGILFEVMATGCKIISGSYINNQNYVYQNLKKENLIIGIPDFTKQKIKKALTISLNKKTNSPSHIDGNSQNRLLKIFNTLRQESLIKLRRASEKDINLTFLWAINPEIRKYSFNQHQITKEEHSKWFSEKIKNKNCFYFIAEYNQTAVGSIRFDISGKDAMISYLLDPLYQGQGLGQVLLKNGVELFSQKIRKYKKSIDHIWGDVMETNIASIKAFRRLGFNEINEQSFFKYIKKI